MSNKKLCIIIGCYNRHNVVCNIYDFIIQLTDNFDFYLVNNNKEIENEIIEKYSNKFIVVQGDNSHFEFSGIQKCLDSIDKEQYSAFILGTDAIFNYPIRYLDFININIIYYVMNNESFIGNIDSFLKNYEFDDIIVNYWVRTSFIMINKDLFKKIKYKFITYYYQDLFDDIGNLKIRIDKELDDFINNWLEMDRYKYIKNINIKKSCIYNEWRLTNKLSEHGKVLDYCCSYLLDFHKEIMTKNNRMVLLANDKYVPYKVLINLDNINWMDQLKLKFNLLN